MRPLNAMLSAKSYKQRARSNDIRCLCEWPVPIFLAYRQLSPPLPLVINMNEEQKQEVEALISIFGPSECHFRDDGCELYFPYGECSNVATLGMHLESSYPSAAPAITLSGLPRGLTEALTVHLHGVSAAHTGEPHLYQLVQELRAWLGLDDVPDGEANLVHTHDEAEDGGTQAAASCTIPIAHGTHGCGVCIDRKSVFQAHVAPVTCRDDVSAVMATLLSEPKIARATHNIVAYRFWHAGTGTWTCEGDDDGEDGAAYKLATMLASMQVRNAVVVVSRWYGGILLGPVRFHHINTVAKQLLEREGYGKDAVGGGATGKAKGK